MFHVGFATVKTSSIAQTFVIYYITLRYICFVGLLIRHAMISQHAANLLNTRANMTWSRLTTILRFVE